MKKLVTLLFILATTIAPAQKLNMELMQDLKPRNIGPAGMSGRVTAFDVVNSNPDIMYAGSASGGLWKSTSGGVKWEPIFTKESTASIGAVAVQQSNPSVIWVGTGEGNPRNSLNGGYGVYRSLDGGKNWQAMGLKNTRHIHRIIIDPTNPNTIYVGAIGSPWGEHPERGVFKTTDGGKNWKKILFVNNKTGVADMVMDPSNPNKLVVAMWEHKRDPWFFKSGGPGSGIYITYDGGEHFKKVSAEDGLPKGELGRIGVAIAKSNPDVIYALVEAKKNALYKSEDGGFKWKMVNNKTEIGTRPFYYSDIFVDPQNENRVYSVFTYVNVSEDGGKSFHELMPAYGVNNGVHPDHHSWWIHPDNGKFMMDGNDGGMNITKDGGKSWRFVGNIPVGQFYHVAVDNEYPYNVYGGMQDNGSWRGPAYVWKAQGIRNSYWQEISFGDGFDVVADPDDSRYGYSMSQQGYVSRYDWKTGNNYSVRPTPPDADTKLRFNWNAAIAQDPFDHSTVYFGSQFVHKSTNKGLTWDVISPDLTTNDPEKQKQGESGGLTMDATGAENHTTIIVIEPSSVEKDMLWTGSDDGRVHYTTDGGANWIDVTKNIKGLPAGSWIPQIKASNKNKGEALLVANDYRRFNYEPYVYRTTNYGKTWKRIVDSDDVESYALSIIEDPENPNLLFLGTDDGLYVSINAGNDWTKWTAGYPTVSTKDLVIHPREQDLVIATFGRAMWVLDDIRPLRSLAYHPDLLDKKIALFTPPTAHMAAYQQPTGSRFGADAMYQGENRNYGAMISFYINPNELKSKPNKGEKADKKKKDSLLLKVFKGEDLIRTLTLKIPKKGGFHRVYWNMDEKGPDRPSRNIPKTSRERGGLRVLPGEYKIQLSYGDSVEETKIEVQSDPRIGVNLADLEEVYHTQKEINAMIQTAANAVKQLVESKNSVDKLLKDMKAATNKEDFKESIDLSKNISEKIEELISLHLGKIDKRQGITRNPEVTVMQRLGLASGYVSSRKSGITDTEKRLIQLAKEELNAALKQQNAFFNEAWKDYRLTIEKTKLQPFKEVKLFKID